MLPCNKIDIWAAGCICAEIISKKPVFMGDGSEIS